MTDRAKTYREMAKLQVMPDVFAAVPLVQIHGLTGSDAAHISAAEQLERINAKRSERGLPPIRSRRNDAKS
jgi:hypothetical protein